jgi:hypothetical protein
LVCNILLRNGDPLFVDYQGGRRTLQYDIASLSTMPRPISLNFASGFSPLSRSAFQLYHWIAKPFCATFTPMFTFASCRRSAPTVFAASMSANRISSERPYALKISAGSFIAHLPINSPTLLGAFC